jgi:acyl-coenzyme A synthetase/AMP-(fatty) acid ligase
MKSFLKDKNNNYTYETLLENINNANSYYQTYKTDVLYDFFLNFIISLLSEKPIVLIDFDINKNEINEFEISGLNTSYNVTLKKYNDFNEIINDILKSKSEVTIFTSGTTGQPKKVTHTIQSLSRAVRISEKHKDNIWGFAYNPTHMAGIQVFLQSFLNMNLIVNLFGSNRNDIYSAINEFSITHISATPTFYRLLLPFEKVFSSLQRITFGGEKSDSKLYESIIRIFPNAKINNVYASTEAGTLFSTQGEYFKIPNDIVDKIKIIDDELLIHYSLLGHSDSLKITDEYYNTGDLIEWVNIEEKTFKFKSRKNELINVGGYKINPIEVENYILEIEGIVQAMVYGKSNSVLGNILCADVKLIENCQLTENEIRSQLISKIQDFKVPRRIKFVDSFSLTRTGKIKRL